MRELPDHTLRYAEHDDGLVDVHLPAATSADSADHETQLGVPQHATRRRWGRGIVLLVHGGFWKTAYDRTHTRAMARALADEGWVVATPEYRRVGTGGDGGWPRACADVVTVAQRLPELLAGIGVEAGPEGIRTIGHSAGGHLVLWLAAVAPGGVDRTVALAPVCDLAEAIRLDLGGGAARRFLGGADPGPADPMRLFDDAGPADVRIVHGVDDVEVPVSLSRGFVARHPRVRLHEVPLGHYELIEPGSATWPAVLAALAD